MMALVDVVEIVGPVEVHFLSRIIVFGKFLYVITLVVKGQPAEEGVVDVRSKTETGTSEKP